MKKTLIALAACLALGSSAFADYVWKGGSEITAAGWADQNNWELTGTTAWNTTGSGPNTTSSDMWAPIVIANASGTTPELDSWNLNMTLTNTQLTVSSINKLQTGVKSTISIDKDSSLTFNNFAKNNADSGSGVVFNVDGSLTINAAKNWPYNEQAVSKLYNVDINLGSTGSITVTGKEMGASKVSVLGGLGGRMA